MKEVNQIYLLGISKMYGSIFLVKHDFIGPAYLLMIFSIFQELNHQEKSSKLLHLHSSGAWHVLYSMLFNLNNCHNIELIHHVLH